MLVSDKRFDYPQAFQFGVRPPVNLRIDESHPLAISDYDYVLSQGRGDTITDLQGQLALTATTPLWTTDYHGVCGDFTATDANKFDATAEPIVTSDGVGTGDFAMLVAGYFVREATEGRAFQQRIGSGDFNSTTFSINEGGTAGTIGFLTSGGGGATSNYTVANAFSSDSFCVFAVSRVGQFSSIYKNGIKLGTSTSQTVRDITVAGQDAAIGGTAAATSLPLNGRIHLVRLFNRALTDGQIYKMSTDLYGHMI